MIVLLVAAEAAVTATTDPKDEIAMIAIAVVIFLFILFAPLHALVRLFLIRVYLVSACMSDLAKR